MNNQTKPTSYRWVICSLLFFATTINYLDRQVLSLTWEDFIRPEFHWTNAHYGLVTGIFSLVYAIGMLFAGRIVDKLDTKKGYMWSIFIWSIGACVHALCGVATEWAVGLPDAEALRNAIGNVDLVARIANISLTLFILARCVLAIGEAGNFPAAIKATAEYFPKKDRAYATSIFNAGTTIGALLAPFTIPSLAAKFGWEAAFIIIGGLGFIWMGFWQFMYKKPDQNPAVNAAELEYINSDSEEERAAAERDAAEKAAAPKVSLWKCFTYRQTWAFISGKAIADGVWWFYLFWMPSYLKNACGMSSTSFEFQLALGVLYLIVMVSVLGGYLPTIFVEKYKMHPYAGRMRAMLIFAFFPLLALFAQPLSQYSYWWPIIFIGIAAAAHQSWSANIFSTVGDMFPKSMIATITGIGGMAGGVGSFGIQMGAGRLFDYAEQTQMTFAGYTGIEAGYMIAFSFCAVAYLISWMAMKAFVPKYKPIIL
ncbi:MAG: MFS transporter [Rikenellaceae bacterium]|nr:MFS transporter [Rikenellaceae bacterium]